VSTGEEASFILHIDVSGHPAPGFPRHLAFPTATTEQETAPSKPKRGSDQSGVSKKSALAPEARVRMTQGAIRPPEPPRRTDMRWFDAKGGETKPGVSRGMARELPEFRQGNSYRQPALAWDTIPGLETPPGARPQTAPAKRAARFQSPKIPFGLRCAPSTRPEITYYTRDSEGKRQDLSAHRPQGGIRSARSKGPGAVAGVKLQR